MKHILALFSDIATRRLACGRPATFGRAGIFSFGLALCALLAGPIAAVAASSSGLSPHSPGSPGVHDAAPAPAQDQIQAQAPATSDEPGIVPPDFTQRLEAATVLVVAYRAEGYTIGSGFTVAPGRVVTNAHVVAGETHEIYLVNSALPPTQAKLEAKAGSAGGEGAEKGGLGLDEQDFAILRFTPPAGVSLPLLAFNLGADRPDRVSAWGYPYEAIQRTGGVMALDNAAALKPLPVVATDGEVSAIVIVNGTRNLVHSAKTDGGSSGGPLLNYRGEVVGMNTWNARGENGNELMNIALPAEEVVKFLRAHNIQPLLASRDPAVLAGFTLSERIAGPRLSPDGFTPTGVAPGQSSGTGGKAPLPGEPAQALLVMDFARLTAQAEKGDPDAQLTVALRYYYGDKGAPEDFDKARLWLRKAATQGNPMAEGLLGLSYIFDAQPKPGEGLALMRRAAARPGAAPALQSALAFVLYRGDPFGVERDIDETFTWAKTAAERGDPNAEGLLGLMLYSGLGVDEDEEKALWHARASARRGSPVGLGLLAWMRHHGTVVAQNDALSALLARNAAEDDDPEAQGLLALLYYEGGKDLAPDRAAAESWARRAALRFDPYGFYILGRLCLEGENKDYALAWAMLDFAARDLAPEPEQFRDEAAARMTESDFKRAKEIQRTWPDVGL